MMTPKECAQAWKAVCGIYKDTIEENRPNKTMGEIVRSLGKEKTKEVFATVCKIKKHDGRIYGTNRKYMESIPVNPDSVKWERENPMIYAGLDTIHPTHINNLITELRTVEGKYENH